STTPASLAGTIATSSATSKTQDGRAIWMNSRPRDYQEKSSERTKEKARPKRAFRYPMKVTSVSGRQLRSACDTRDELADKTLILAARRGRAGNEVEDLAVLHPVMGYILNPAILAKVDRQDLLVCDARVHKGDRTTARLRNVVQDLIVERGSCRRRAKCKQNLFAARAHRHHI